MVAPPLKTNNEVQYNGVTFTDNRTTFFSMRKVKGFERWKSFRLWFKPWIIVEREIPKEKKI